MAEVSLVVQQQKDDASEKTAMPTNHIKFPWKYPEHKDDSGDEDKEELEAAAKAPEPDTDGDDVDLHRLPTLQRLPGWPTEFPRNLEAYRDDILNNATHRWASDYEKHRMEIAPWVWHHRGDADILMAESQSPNSTVSQQAIYSMLKRGIIPNYERKANASFVVLLRNRELDAFRGTMRQLEERFNHKYHYPYLFLNDKPFTQRFMRMVAASTTSNVTFALVPRDHWSMPDSIDPQKALESRQQMKANNVIYGGSLSYRHMCRYNSGFFYKHPLLQAVDWYWRVEPGVDFYCDLPYDPFMYMQNAGKLYSFVIALKELEATIPTLWDHTLEYMRHANASSDWMSYFVDVNGDYNLCHFWSNFEIASLNWLRSAPYEAYFEYLDKAKGFFMERWGDAPVHSLAAGFLLRRDQVHFFDDIGYRHENFARCPAAGAAMDTDLRCTCPKDIENFDTSGGSCLPKWKSYLPLLWTIKDTEEALHMVREARFLTGGREPRMIRERRRWYDFFGRF
ncbi:hypothetical protein GGI23_003353 [Coemansia sp. RSA 2559]|nr:hypothetical protein GGI23_003353 [Coemansia sp. RSA 2559]